MAKFSQSRRYFFRACAALAAGFGLWRYLGVRPQAAEEVLRVNRQDIPAEGAVVYADQRAALVRRGSEFYALSLVCTHLGCIVKINADNITCPCHGSRFDLEGQVLSGPAPRALERLTLRQPDAQTFEILLPARV